MFENRIPTAQNALISKLSFTMTAIAASVLLLATSTAAAQIPDVPRPGEYRIIGGYVDAGTYNGWRIFHTACFGCHGMDATGTKLAPNLVERIKTMTPKSFVIKVLTSYSSVVTAGEPDLAVGPDDLESKIRDLMRRERSSEIRIVMPAWEDSPIVEPHVLDIFAYLLARADRKLGTGRPPVAGLRRSKQE